MKARAIYLLLAREVSTDSNDSMNSIIKIIDKFNIGYKQTGTGSEKSDVDRVIAFPVNYAIASSWLFDKPLVKETSIAIKSQIIDPSGKTIAEQKFPPNKIKTGLKINLNFVIQGLPATTSGIYQLKAHLIIDEQVVSEAEYPYEVQLNAQE